MKLLVRLKYKQSNIIMSKDRFCYISVDEKCQNKTYQNK